MRCVSDFSTSSSSFVAIGSSIICGADEKDEVTRLVVLGGEKKAWQPLRWIAKLMADDAKQSFIVALVLGNDKVPFAIVSSSSSSSTEASALIMSVIVE